VAEWQEALSLPHPKAEHPLVALTEGGDLFVCAKYLFVCAKHATKEAAAQAFSLPISNQTGRWQSFISSHSRTDELDPFLVVREPSMQDIHG
jgi:hypothetical protein